MAKTGTTIQARGASPCRPRPKTSGTASTGSSTRTAPRSTPRSTTPGSGSPRPWPRSRRTTPSTGTNASSGRCATAPSRRADHLQCRRPGPKPATSTINCTVSGIIHDSMDDILAKVHEAGLTLKAGCGIGYEFSTLRPRGAYVSGAGAHTSGPLSFMDIYDKMCFTVSSAGGRRARRWAPSTSATRTCASSFVPSARMAACASSTSAC